MQSKVCTLDVYKINKIHVSVCLMWFYSLWIQYWCSVCWYQMFGT